MRWLRRHHPSESRIPPGEGSKAHAEAVDRIAAVDGRWPEVQAVAGSLRKLRTENHFSDQIAAIFSGRRE